MIDKANTYIDDVNLSKDTSLKHLLNSDGMSDIEDDTDIDIIKHSSYYTESEYQGLQIATGSFNVMSFNCQSINAKFDELSLFIERLNKTSPLSVICLQESWLKNDCGDSLFNIPDYTLVNQGRTVCSNHGGLMIFVHDRFNVLPPLKIIDSTNGWEYLCIEISQTLPYPKKYIIGNVYRPPCEIIEKFNIFLDEFDLFMNNLSKMKRSIYINGDFNIDLLKMYSKQHYNTFFDNIMSSGFYPKITLPTRITEKSNTLLDNILTNVVDNNAISGIFINQISDHQPIFMCSNEVMKEVHCEKYIDIEPRDDLSMNKFIDELKRIDIFTKLNKNPTCSPSENYDIFAKLLLFVKKKYLPKKRIKFNKRKHKKNKWITRGIIKSINTKDKLYKILVQTNSENQEIFHLKKNSKSIKNYCGGVLRRQNAYTLLIHSIALKMILSKLGRS